MPGFNRRDFLRLGSALSGVLALSQLAPQLSPSGSLPNILLLVFDAMSAEHLSLYGYRRKTTPNLERFAERATVFHHHYSTSNFTTPGTASLLTGLHPWTHRAINYSGLLARDLTDHNLFHALGKRYYRLAYSQNMWPNYLFGQFHGDIERLLSPATFSVVDEIVGDKVAHDLDASYRAFDDFLFRERTPPPSLVFGLAQRLLLRRAYAHAPADEYPRGLPRAGDYAIFFRLSDVFDGMTATIGQLKTPFLAYWHTWSPHEPYRPTKDFDRLFVDGWRPIAKPSHKLGGSFLPNHMNTSRRNYDEYIANVDFEFGRLLDFLRAKGILDNSYVVVTADHGELFERGTEGHVTPLLYEALVHIPLIISAPTQKSRKDIRVPTSAIDVLPTLAHLSGVEVPAWCEGQVLAGFGGPESPDRSIFMMYAARNTAFSSLSHGSFVLRKGPHKLIYYRSFPAYDNEDTFELYDIQNDPAELNNAYSENSQVGGALRTELLARIDAENARFRN